MTHLTRAGHEYELIPDGAKYKPIILLAVAAAVAVLDMKINYPFTIILLAIA